MNDLLRLQESPGPRPPLLWMKTVRCWTAWTWARWWSTKRWARSFSSTPCASTSTNAAPPAPWWWRVKMTASAGACPEISPLSSGSRISLRVRVSASRLEKEAMLCCWAAFPVDVRQMSSPGCFASGLLHRNATNQPRGDWWCVVTVRWRETAFSAYWVTTMESPGATVPRWKVSPSTRKRNRRTSTPMSAKYEDHIFFDGRTF